MPCVYARLFRCDMDGQSPGRDRPHAPPRSRVQPAVQYRTREPRRARRVRSRKSRAFYVDCLGYIVWDEDNDALYLRGVEERNHHSVVLRKSDDIAALAIGFKVGSEEDLDKAAAWLERAS